MEIRFIFDKKEVISELVELKSKYNFDDRNGLNYIIVGEHWSEIEDEHRLIYQIERILNIDLSLLDYWNPKVFENELKIDDVQKVLENLKNKIEQNPNFYEKINYGFNLKEISECFDDSQFENKLIRFSTTFRILYSQISLIEIVIFLKVCYSYDNKNLEFKKYAENIIRNYTMKNIRELIITFFNKHNLNYYRKEEING